jgi:hypothetical protein
MADWVSQAGRVKDRSDVWLKLRLDGRTGAGLRVKQMDRSGVRIMVRLGISLIVSVVCSLLISRPGTFWFLFPANV